jgi:hypothetical protein
MKAASHPSVNICGIALEVLSKLVSSEIGLANQLLPILQRRAIAPHRFVNGVPSLVASDICGANFQEFEIFRETILTDSLVACWKPSEEYYFASCTAAIGEFCSRNASAQVSFHLEAALFCMGAVAEETMAGTAGLSSHSAYLERCTAALGGKPQSLTSNPLTLTQACHFVRKVSPTPSSGYVFRGSLTHKPAHSLCLLHSTKNGLA